MTEARPIRPKDRDQVLQALRAGVVPQAGLQHIQVGRAREVESLIGDLCRIVDGGSCFRLVIGDYGSGKTFFLSLVRSISLEKKIVTAHADLNPDRRIHSTSGQARSLYSELTRSLSTRSKPDGGAISSVVERFVTSAIDEAKAVGQDPGSVIKARLASLSEMVGGYDFAEVVAAYYRGYETGNDTLKSDAVRWIRGEFTTKTDARQALGVRTIVDDANFYEMLKLLARFVRLAGYSGLLVCLDEMVNLYKLSNVKARNSNYEQILRILNDSLQGSSVGLGIIMGGTPEFLMDSRRGLYSYHALESRLAENQFKSTSLVDFSGPTLNLAALTPEDLFILLQKLRHVQAFGDPAKYLMNDEALKAFMAHCTGRIGDAYFRTPRNTIVAFLHLLAILEQNPQASLQELLGKVLLAADPGPDANPTPEGELENGTVAEQMGREPVDPGDDDELKTFRLK